MTDAYIVVSPQPSMASTRSFHHPRHPHTGQLYFAIGATIIYVIAVPSLLALHNYWAAVGWGVSALLCAFWTALLLQENRWRKLEQLEASDTGDYSPPTHYATTSLGISPAPPSTVGSPSQQRAYQQPLVNSGPMPVYTEPFPWYITRWSLAIVILIGLGCIAVAAYFFAYAGQHGEKLNAQSHWLPAIAFVGAMKSASQLGWRMGKMRRTFFSVTTFLRESQSN